jgi:hypothetical protein
MIVGILVVVWLAVLSPIVIRRLRDRDTDRSIVNFHERMARLGTGSPLVEPAHRLDVSDEAPPREVGEHEMNPPTRAPRLRLVPADATTTGSDRDLSWEEWSRAFGDEPFESPSPVRQRTTSVNPRAAAYSRVPVDHVASRAPAGSPFSSRRQRARRRRTILQLAASVVVSTVLVVLVNNVLVDVWALASWLALAGFFALMYYAMTTGLLGSASARPRVDTARPAPVRPAARRAAVAYEDEYEDDAYEEPRYARAL